MAIPFTEFERTKLGVTFSPGQSATYRVAFDGLEPSELVGEEKALAERIYATDSVRPLARRVFVQKKGARVGGSRFAGDRIVHLGLTLPAPPLGHGERLFALFVAPDLRIVRQPFAFALGSAQALGRSRNATADSFELVRDDGLVVIVQCLPATAGGSAVRGRSLIGAVMSEASFFRDASSVVNDEEVYRALLPRIIKGGQLIIESTPWTESGLLYQLYDRNFGNPREALVANTPTLLLRDSEEMRAHVAAERERDPATAANEFDAEFRGGGGSTFFSAAEVDACVLQALPMPAAPLDGATSAAGADFGFKTDASALAIVQVREGAHWLACLEEVVPTRGEPLVPSHVAKHFAGIMRRYECKACVIDSHYELAIKEHVAPFGIDTELAPAGAQGKLDSYLYTREMLREKKLALPPHGRLIAQLKLIVAKPVAGGGMSLDFPRGRYGLAHGDAASALINAVWATKAATEPNIWDALTRAREAGDLRHLGPAMYGPGRRW